MKDAHQLNYLSPFQMEGFHYIYIHQRPEHSGSTLLGATTGVHAITWNYDNPTYKTNFETWFGSVNSGVYIGLLYAGWVGMVIGYKQGSDGSFAILKYNLQNGFEKFVTIENGTFSWGAY